MSIKEQKVPNGKKYPNRMRFIKRTIIALIGILLIVGAASFYVPKIIPKIIEIINPSKLQNTHQSSNSEPSPKDGTSPKNTDSQTAPKDGSAEDVGIGSTSAIQWEDALKYLQENTNKVYKDSLDSYPDLNGFFDLLNSYRFKDFVEAIDKHPQHSRDIKKFDVWKRLYDMAKEIGSNKEGLYDAPDQPITFDNYFKQISKKFLNREGTTSANANPQGTGKSPSRQGRSSNNAQDTKNQGNATSQDDVN
jgi:hypothetical protein